MTKTELLHSLVEKGAVVGGGVVAGVLDARFALARPLADGVSASAGGLLALGGLAVGIAKVGPSGFHKFAGNVGAGAAAYEAGKIAYNRTTAAMGAVAAQGVAGRNVLPFGGARRVMDPGSLRTAAQAFSTRAA